MPAPDAFSVAEARALRHAFKGLVIRWDLSEPDTLALISEPIADEAERVERLRGPSGVNRMLLLLHPER